MNLPRIELDNYLGQAFNSIPVAMIVVTHEGDITRVNRLAEAIFGYASEELIGQKVEVLLPNRYRASHPRFRGGFLAETGARPMGLGRDLSGLRKDGSEFPVEIGINPVETGEGPMILSVIVDLSERKQAEQRIRDALAQKDLLLREVHHRVKNNLQVIHSLLDLQALQLSDERLLGVLRESQNRIQTMSLIHQTLYRSNDLARVDFQRFLDDLLPNVAATYRNAQGHVTIEAEAQGMDLPIDDAIPCGLIINELVSNALKHGFAQGHSGRVEVCLAQAEPGVLELSVSNDGRAISDSLDLDQSSTLGLMLVHSLTRQLNGTLTVQRAHPTRFCVRFARKPAP